MARDEELLKQASTAPRRRTRRNARNVESRPPVTKKGEITRARLKEATAQLLEERSYRDLRISDIVERAGCNINAFYYYFKDKQAIVLEVISEIMNEQARRAKHETGAQNDLFARIYRGALREAKVYEAYPGLMRSAAQFADDEPDLAAIFYEANQDFVRRLVKDIALRMPDSGLGGDETFALATALTLMVDGFLGDYYMAKNEELRSAIPNTGDVARFLAICWFRMLYLRNPSPDELGRFQSFARTLLPSEQAEGG